VIARRKAAIALVTVSALGVCFGVLAPLFPTIPFLSQLPFVEDVIFLLSSETVLRIGVVIFLFAAVFEGAVILNRKESAVNVANVNVASGQACVLARVGFTCPILGDSAFDPPQTFFDALRPKVDFKVESTTNEKGEGEVASIFEAVIPAVKKLKKAGGKV